VPPLVSDLDLSVDDRWLYVSCWGTGELKQHDVTDLLHPVQTGSVRLGGIVGRHPTPPPPTSPGRGAQMVEVSRDGRRAYVPTPSTGPGRTSSTPRGRAWMAKLDTDPVAGGLTADPRFFPNGDDFRGLRVHQTRLQGGDASSDSYCHTTDHAPHRPPPRRAGPRPTAVAGQRRPVADRGHRPRLAGNHPHPTHTVPRSRAMMGESLVAGRIV
jgi:56kDa selenium binding protein (SBP56)